MRFQPDAVIYRVLYRIRAETYGFSLVVSRLPYLDLLPVQESHIYHLVTTLFSVTFLFSCLKVHRV